MPYPERFSGWWILLHMGQPLQCLAFSTQGEDEFYPRCSVILLWCRWCACSWASCQAAVSSYTWALPALPAVFLKGKMIFFPLVYCNFTLVQVVCLILNIFQAAEYSFIGTPPCIVLPFPFGEDKFTLVQVVCLLLNIFQGAASTCTGTPTCIVVPFPVGEDGFSEV